MMSPVNCKEQFVVFVLATATLIPGTSICGQGLAAFESASLDFGTEFRDSESGIELRPYLAQNKEFGAIAFATSTIPVMRVSKAIPFVVIIREESQSAVTSTLTPTAFPTVLGFSGNIAISEIAEFGLAYELVSRSFQEGKESYFERLRVYTPELPPNKYHEFDIAKGRLFIITVKDKTEPITIDQLSVKLEMKTMTDILDGSGENDEKAAKLLEFAKSLIEK